MQRRIGIMKRTGRIKLSFRNSLTHYFIVLFRLLTLIVVSWLSWKSLHTFPAFLHGKKLLKPHLSVFGGKIFCFIYICDK